jgi:hypothetical protein
MAVNIVDGTGPVGGPMRDAFDPLSVVGVVRSPRATVHRTRRGDL